MKHTALTLPVSSRSGSHTTMWSRTARGSSPVLDIESCVGPGNILPHDLSMDAPTLWSDTAGGVLIAVPALTYSASARPRGRS